MGQWQHIDGDAFCFYLLLYVAPIVHKSKGVEVVNIGAHKSCKGYGRHTKLACCLRIDYILAPSSGAIGASVQLFGAENLLLRQGYLLHMRAFNIGHLACHTHQVHVRIYLISKQHWFLLVHGALVCRYLDEQILASNGLYFRSGNRYILPSATT